MSCNLLFLRFLGDFVGYCHFVQFFDIWVIRWYVSLVMKTLMYKPWKTVLAVFAAVVMSVAGSSLYANSTHLNSGSNPLGNVLKANGDVNTYAHYIGRGHRHGGRMYHRGHRDHRRFFWWFGRPHYQRHPWWIRDFDHHRRGGIYFRF